MVCFRHTAVRHGTLVLAVGGLHLLICWGIDKTLGVSLWTSAGWTDLALTLLLSILVYLISRSKAGFLALMTLALLALHGSNALKIRTLGGPIMPDDLYAARSLFLIMTDTQRLLALGFLALLAFVVWRTLSFRSGRSKAALAILLSLPLPVVIAPSVVVSALDERFGHIVWSQRTNYESRGPLLHMIQETARHVALKVPPPDAGQVLEAVARLSPDVVPALAETRGVVGPTRSVVLVVLESFWDPSALTAAGLSRDPLDPDFRALWRDAGYSRALVPVFGGYTANSEFEALCGFPVAEDTVFFETRLKNDAPCLPRLLSEAGYATTASHPNIPVFWNRVNAYRRVGFDSYRSQDDFILDDLQGGEYLSDASLYRQVLDGLRPIQDSGTPSFTYVLTFFGHLDYPLDESLMKVQATDPMVGRYASTVLEKSRAFMAFLREVQARDPEALVVAVGDHLPVLGPDFAAYRESGVLAADRSEFEDRMFRDLVATPLLVIDGPRGAVPVGTLALYQLPGLIRSLLGLERPAPMDLLQPPAGVVLRPLPGVQVALDADNTTLVCRSPLVSDVCAAQSDWLAAVETVSRDLFSGQRHTLVP